MKTFWACCACTHAGEGYTNADRHTLDTGHPVTTGTRPDAVNRVAANIREETATDARR